MAYVYILKDKFGKYYVSTTENIEQRLKRHQCGKVGSTKNKLPVTLVFSEFHPTKSDARKKEYKIKKWKSRIMIEKIIKQGPFV